MTRGGSKLKQKAGGSILWEIKEQEFCDGGLSCEARCPISRWCENERDRITKLSLYLGRYGFRVLPTFVFFSCLSYCSCSNLYLIVLLRQGRSIMKGCINKSINTIPREYEIKKQNTTRKGCSTKLLCRLEARG